MEVTEVKLYKSKKEGIVKAFGKATLDNELSLDVLVMDKMDGNGAWVTFPNGKTGKDGKYYLPIFFKTKELDQAFKSKVLEAYNTELSGVSTYTNNQPVNKPQENLPF